MDAQTASVWGLEPMLSVTELAEYLGVPVATVYDWRTNGCGPVAHRFGKHVKFALSDVRVGRVTTRTIMTRPPRRGGAESAQQGASSGGER